MTKTMWSAMAEKKEAHYQDARRRLEKGEAGFTAAYVAELREAWERAARRAGEA